MYNMCIQGCHDLERLDLEDCSYVSVNWVLLYLIEWVNDFISTW